MIFLIKKLGKCLWLFYFDTRAWVFNFSLPSLSLNFMKTDGFDRAQKHKRKWGPLVQKQFT